MPLPKNPRSPPWAAEPGSFDCSFASLAKSPGIGLERGERGLGLLAGRGLVAAFGRKQDVARPPLLIDAEAPLVLFVVRLDVRIGDGGGARDRFGTEHEVLDLDALRRFEVLLVPVVELGHLRIGDRDLGEEVVRADRKHTDLALLQQHAIKPIGDGLGHDRRLEDSRDEHLLAQVGAHALLEASLRQALRRQVGAVAFEAENTVVLERRVCRR